MSKYIRKCAGVDPNKGNCWQIYADEAQYIAECLPDKESRWRVIGMAFDRWVGLSDEKPADGQELGVLMYREVTQRRHAKDFIDKCERSQQNRTSRNRCSDQSPPLHFPRRPQPPPVTQLPQLPPPGPGEYDGPF